MRIGMIGAGNIGATAAELFLEAGHEVALSNSRGPETLEDLVDELGPGARARTVEGAARFGDLAMEAIPFGEYRDLPAEALAGRVVISASNYYPGRDGEIELDGLTETELVARHLSGSRVVKAFNTIFWKNLRDQGDPSKPMADRRAIPLAGDDPDARDLVAGLIEEIGFAPLDLGGLREGGRRMQPGSAIYTEDLTVEEARAVLEGGG